MRDWINSLQSDGKLADDPNFSFVSDWCTAIEQVLDQYGSVLKKRRTEIYYLDLALIFEAHRLKNTYEEHGVLMRREQCSLFSTTGAPRLAREAVPRHRQIPQLCDPSKSRDLAPGIFFHEPNRDIFIWSYNTLWYDSPILFAQSASTGKQLPPTSNSVVWPDGCLSLVVEGYDMSRDGKHIGIVYQDDRGPLLITIWEIDLSLDFTRRIRAPLWAHLIHRSTIDEPFIVKSWLRSTSCFAMDQDGVFLTPNGVARTTSTASLFLVDKALQHFSENLFLHCSKTSSLWYSRNGKFLFVYSPDKITKYTVPGLDNQFQLSLSARQKDLLAISPSGRYFACTSDLYEEQIDIRLIDTLTGITVVLSLSEKIGDIVNCTFCSDDGVIVACYVHEYGDQPASTTLHIYIFTGLPSNVRLRASGKCAYDCVLYSSSLHVSYDHGIAYLVTDRGEIQRIVLGD